ncbi:protein SPT2 homolog isoform X1 [Hydra vulgaris]|uniref:protein SPT2 homolog isoform X1 n=1 Tax=Hydra vulgaris TaxID=6087 RepID=UPI00019271AF|nr:protein SPT2 homolog [Hydra vulgaris]
MDFKDLLQIAEGNTSLSKKKAAKFSANKYDSKNVSSSAVAKYLSKKREEAEIIKAKEIEARKQRILARLQSSDPVKKEKSEHQNISSKKDTDQKTDLRVADNVKKKMEIKLLSKSIENTKKDKPVSKQVEISHLKSKSEIGNSQKHAQTKENNPKPSKLAKSSMSFAELAALAKTNSKTAKVENLSVKKPIQKKSDIIDPDQNVKVKKIQNSSKNQKIVLAASSSDKINTKNKDQKLVSTISNKNSSRLPITQKNNNNNLTNAISKKQKISSGGKCGLIAETICEGSIKNKGAKAIIEPKSSVKKILSDKTIVKNTSKKSAKDIESEFEKEERILARKRKLFEMRRVTGNNDLKEADIYDEEDYDLDEYDSEDDDFIDNSEEPGDVSHYIKKIFGYDRSRYSDTDDEDLKNMDSSYSQIEKEEARSARIARIEDEYEAMKEQEELERKLNAKKRKLKK